MRGGLTSSFPWEQRLGAGVCAVRPPGKSSGSRSSCNQTRGVEESQIGKGQKRLHALG